MESYAPPRRHDRLVVAGLLGRAPAHVGQPRLAERAAQLVAQQRAQARAAAGRLPALAVAAQRELRQLVAAAVVVPVPDLEGDRAGPDAHRVAGGALGHAAARSRAG